MIARCVGAILAVLAAGASAAYAQGAGGMILGVEIAVSNPQPVRPSDPVNDLREFANAWRYCWSPPPLERGRQPLDLAFQVSFKRSGELFGKPRAISFSREVTAEERQRYYRAVAEAVDLCSQMP